MKSYYFATKELQRILDGVDEFMNSVTCFIGSLISAILVGGAILLIAREIRLAALRWALEGSVRLSNFTLRMTGTKLNLK
jgi:uncharacterized membrane protein